MRNMSGIVLLMTMLLFSKPAMEAQVKPGAPEAVLDRLLTINSLIGGETPRWAPDGSAIMFASSMSGRSGIWSVSPSSGFPGLLIEDTGGIGFLASQTPRWSPKGDWISYISDKSGSPEIWLWSATEGNQVKLTSMGARISSYNWSPDGKWIAFAGDRHGNFDIWRVAVPSGEVFRVTTGSFYEVSPSWSPDGSKILFVRLNDAWTDHDVVEYSLTDQKSRVIVRDKDFFDYGASARSKFGYPLVSPDGKWVLFRSHRSGWINSWVAPMAGGEPRQIAPEEADQSDASWSPDGKWIAYTSNHNGTHDLRVVAAPGGSPRVLLSPKMGVIADAEWSPDGKQISYTLTTPTQPRDLYVVSLNDGASKQLTRSMPGGIPLGTLVPPEKVSYRSTDGFVINAYLYRPPEAQPARQFPGILWIHGGPTSQFNDNFEQHVQFFVHMGYVVLMPNIRGSSGYGKKFEDANNRCWGHCDLQDVVAGVDYLKTLSYVNPNRTGITGTSYGGCMSLAAIAFAPGVFQAAIPASGYGDWIHFYKEQELRHIKLVEYEFGSLPENEEIYRKNSPIHWIRNVSTPTFLVHGEGGFPRSDASREFANRLAMEYKPHRYKTYSGDNYYVRSRKNRREMLLDMLEFFDQHLKDKVMVTSSTRSSN